MTNKHITEIEKVRKEYEANLQQIPHHLDRRKTRGVVQRLVRLEKESQHQQTIEAVLAEYDFQWDVDMDDLETLQLQKIVCRTKIEALSNNKEEEKRIHHKANCEYFRNSNECSCGFKSNKEEDE